MTTWQFNEWIIADISHLLAAVLKCCTDALTMENRFSYRERSYKVGSAEPGFPWEKARLVLLSSVLLTAVAELQMCLAADQKHKIIHSGWQRLNPQLSLPVVCGCLNVSRMNDIKMLLHHRLLICSNSLQQFSFAQNLQLTENGP